MRSLTVLFALGLMAAACSGDDDAPPLQSSTTTTVGSAADDVSSDDAAPDDPQMDDAGPDGDDDAGSTTTSTTIERPEGVPADNALVILGDTLGIIDSCAGRNEAGDVEYRYDLSNGGDFVATLDEGAVISIVYRGRSGTFRSSDVTDESADDGFVTGRATASDGSTETDVRYRATIPIQNCETAATSTTSSSTTTTTG